MTTQDRATAPAAALLTAAVLSVGAGMIHVAAAATHLAGSPAMGYGFLAVAVLQVLFGGALLRGATRPPVLLAGAALHLAAIGAWAVSRTTGLPVGHPGPEAAGPADVGTVVLQAVAVGFVAWSLRRREARGSGGPASVTALALAGVLATGGMAIALGDLGSGHGHEAAGSGHGSDEHTDRRVATSRPAGPPAGRELTARPTLRPAAAVGEEPASTGPGDGHGHEPGAEHD